MGQHTNLSKEASFSIKVIIYEFYRFVDYINGISQLVCILTADL
jgi:hypothetical protein